MRASRVALIPALALGLGMALDSTDAVFILRTDSDAVRDAAGDDGASP